MAPGMRTPTKEHFLASSRAGLEAGLAAGLAYWLGQLLLGSESPIYAPVAAVVVIGAGQVRRIGRVTSMLTGMALAIVVSEVGVRLIGTGPVQMAALTAIAIIVTRIMFDDLLAVAYAGLNAAVLVALGGEGWVPDRMAEAVVGAATAYGLVYFVFPPRPSNYIRDAIEDQVSTARSNLTAVAESLRSGSAVEADEANGRSEGVDRNVDFLIDTFDFSDEVARFSPWRRAERSKVDHLRRRARRLEWVLRESTAVVRVASRYARQRAPERHFAEAMSCHACAISAMGDVLAEDPNQERLESICEMADDAVAHARRGRDDGDTMRVAMFEATRGLSETIQEWAGEIREGSDDTSTD